MGWVGEVDGRYLTHPALRAPLQWRGSAVAELTLNTSGTNDFAATYSARCNFVSFGSMILRP